MNIPIEDPDQGRKTVPVGLVKEVSRSSMDDLREKRASVEKSLRDLRDLEDRARIAEQWPIWKAREGSYWRFRNSYSCPESEADYWWKYRRMTNITQDGLMDILEFQIDKDGKLEITEMRRMPWMMQTAGWEPSTEGEWHEAAISAQGIAGRLI